MKKLSTKHRCLVESFFITQVKLTFHSPVVKGIALVDQILRLS